MRDTAARGSPNVGYLFIGVSRYLHVPGLDSFLPKSTSHGLGVGRQESNTPLIPPLYGREKYGDLCCVQCRFINCVSRLLPNRKSYYLVRSRTFSRCTMGLVARGVTEADLLFYKSVLQWQDEEETNIQCSGTMTWSERVVWEYNAVVNICEDIV